MMLRRTLRRANAGLLISWKLSNSFFKTSYYFDASSPPYVEYGNEGDPTYYHASLHNVVGNGQKKYVLRRELKYQKRNEGSTARRLKVYVARHISCREVK